MRLLGEPIRIGIVAIISFLGLGCGAPKKTAATVAHTTVGTAIGTEVSALLGADGGTLQSDDGVLTLDVPPGALAVETLLKVQPISAEAPGSVRAWRLLPEGQKFLKPVSISVAFQAHDVEGSAAAALEMGSQNSDKSWTVSRDFSLGVNSKHLNGTTLHFSDWSLLQGFQLRPGQASVKTGKTLTVTVNDCELVDQGDVTSLKAECRPLGEVDVSSAWSVNGKAGGSTVTGTIADIGKSTGLFTAPALKPTPADVSVSAVIVNNHRSNGGKVTLLSNLTVVDSDGWSGTISYSAIGSEDRDETTVLSETTVIRHQELRMEGSGLLKLEPGSIPGTLEFFRGGAIWTESYLDSIDGTNTNPVCGYHTTSIDKEVFAGNLEPDTAGNPVLFAVTRSSYSVQLVTSTGTLNGSLTSDSAGTTTGSGNCTAILPTHGSSPGTDEAPPQPILLSGSIDSKTPNSIHGTLSVTGEAHGSNQPVLKSQVTWDLTQP